MTLKATLRELNAIKGELTDGGGEVVGEGHAIFERFCSGTVLDYTELLPLAVQFADQQVTQLALSGGIHGRLNSEVRMPADLLLQLVRGVWVDGVVTGARAQRDADAA